MVPSARHLRLLICTAINPYSRIDPEAFIIFILAEFQCLTQFKKKLCQNPKSKSYSRLVNKLLVLSNLHEHTHIPGKEATDMGGRADGALLLLWHYDRGLLMKKD